MASGGEPGFFFHLKNVGVCFFVVVAICSTALDPPKETIGLC